LLIDKYTVYGQLARLFPEGYGADTSPFMASINKVAVQFAFEGEKVTGFDFYGDAYKKDQPANEPVLETVHAHFLKL
jgi:hypothetical protein